jgi:hypothetical protein
MKPTSVTRRSNRPRARTRSKPRWTPKDQHCIQYATADDIEAHITYGTPIEYHRVMLSCFEKNRGDSYLDNDEEPDTSGVQLLS